MARIVVLLIAGLGAAAAAGADREIVRIQREIALLGQSVDSLQRSVDERLASVLTLMEQTLDRVNENAAISDGIQERLTGQDEDLAAPLAAIAKKLGGMSSEYLAVRDAMSAVDARLTRLEAALERLEDAVRIIQAPAPPPPPNPESGA